MCSVPRLSHVTTSERSSNARSTSDAASPRVRDRTASRAARRSCDCTASSRSTTSSTPAAGGPASSCASNRAASIRRSSHTRPMPSFSKGEVSRAGTHLARRLEQVRAGERPALVDAADPGDLHAREVVEWWRDEHDAAVTRVYEAVERVAPPLHSGHGSRDSVSVRSKRLDRMIEKLTREPGKLASMADIGGVRAVPDTQDDADTAHRQLMDMLEVVRVRDWVRNPRSTGYRGIHLHVRQDGRMIEVQLRTFTQDWWANLVEEESRASGVNYKGGQGEPAVLEV